MANTYTNSVPLGREGTGSAFILPKSQSVNRLLETIDYNDQVRQQQQALKYQQAQKVASDWQKNLLKADGGLYWQPEFNKRYQDHLQKGIELKKLGVNPYGTPRNEMENELVGDYLLERQRLLQDTEARKKIEGAVGEQFKQLKTDPYSFRAKTIDELNKYTQMPFDEASRSQVPILQKAFDTEKEYFNLADAVTTEKEYVNPEQTLKIRERVMDEPATRQVGENILLNNPRGRDFVEDKIGVSVDEVRGYPETIDANVELLTKGYNGDPEFRGKLATGFGITTKDQAKQYFQEVAKKRVEKKDQYNRLLGDFAKRAGAKVNPMRSELPYTEDDRLRLAQANGVRADRRENRLPSGGDSVSPAQFTVTQKEFRKPVKTDGSGGESVAKFDKFVSVNPTAFGTSQLKSAYDVRKGKNVSMPAAGSVELTGIGYTTVKGGGKQLKASIVDKDGREYFVNVSDLPLKLRNDKYYKSARQALGTAPSTPKTVTKTTTFKGIPKGGF